MILGRVVERKTNDKGHLLYLINDNTGAIHVTDYNAGNKAAQANKDYNFKYSIIRIRYSLYGYARIHCVIGKGHDLSLEVISNVKDYNELTNHWLNIVTARCIRKFGALTEEELKGAEIGDNPQSKYTGLTEKEKLV